MRIGVADAAGAESKKEAHLTMIAIGNNPVTNELPQMDTQIAAVDPRMIAIMRCILAFAGLVIYNYYYRLESAKFVTLTFAVLISYYVWSALTLAWAVRHRKGAPPIYEHWVDIFLCAALFALTQGNARIFFFFFLFAILVASLSRGYREGLIATAASVILFVLVSLSMTFSGRNIDIEIESALILPLYLLTIGYLMANWGGHEISKRRRLRLLQDTDTQWNPRFGVDNAINKNITRTMHFFSASSCVLVIKRPTSPPTFLTYSASHNAQNRYSLPTIINEDIASLLLNLPDTLSICWNPAPKFWRRIFSGEGTNKNVDASTAEKCRLMSNLLDNESFLSVPYAQRDGTEGRVFITPKDRPFSRHDLDFTEELVTTIARVVESIQLIDELMFKAAEHERYRISLDIHDTTIQPYIGLKLGLDALKRQAGDNNPVSKGINELIEMTDITIKDLRRYAKNLRDDRTPTGDSLVIAINEQAVRFKRFYGIEVAVECISEVHVNSRIAGAVLQILAEGLSNVLRHTQAKRVFISVRCEIQQLFLDIANELPNNMEAVSEFAPRSINARVQSLGGTVFVNHNSHGRTILQVCIPL